MPYSVAVVIEMSSPSLAPTWKVMVTWPFSSGMPLNWAEVPMRWISQASWVISDWMAVWSCVESVPFLYSTASSRTRCSIAWTSLS